MDHPLGIKIPYGQNEVLSFDLEERNVLAILDPPDVTPAANVAQEVRRALSEPINASSLSDLVRGKSNAVIVADDLTRLTPTDKIIPVLLDEMNRGGLPDESISLVIALGTHRSMTQGEILSKFGEGTVERIEIINHDFRDPARIIDLGRTDNGTPIEINRKVYEADFLIGVGSVYPHHIAGFAGGAKIVQPGVSGATTTGYTHLIGCKARPTNLGKIENLVREEMEHVAERCGMGVVLNTVLNKNGRCIKAFFGDIRSAFRSAVELSRNVHGIPFSSKADIVVASSYPMDIEFWQAHKSLYPAELSTKPNGTIILVTPCPEGVSKSHSDMLEYTPWPPSQIEAAIDEGTITDIAAAALAIAWANVREDRNISVVSGGISDQEVEKLGFVPFESVEEALREAFERYGSDAKVSILPYAPETLPLHVPA